MLDTGYMDKNIDKEDDEMGVSDCSPLWLLSTRKKEEVSSRSIKVVVGAVLIKVLVVLVVVVMRSVVFVGLPL